VFLLSTSKLYRCCLQHGIPSWWTKSWNITYIRNGKEQNLCCGYSEINSINSIHTDWVGIVVRLETCIRKVHSQSPGIPASLTEDFCGFPRLFQTHTNIVHRLDHNCYISYPFQFIIHPPSCHSSLCSLDMDSIIK
jgi:hypothetical protein